MVRPCSGRAALWAAQSMPRARPDTTVTPQADSSRARVWVRRRLSGEQAREPTTATQALSSSDRSPRAYSKAGASGSSRSRDGSRGSVHSRMEPSRSRLSSHSGRASRRHASLSNAAPLETGTPASFQRATLCTAAKAEPKQAEQTTYAARAQAFAPAQSQGRPVFGPGGCVQFGQGGGRGARVGHDDSAQGLRPMRRARWVASALGQSSNNTARCRDALAASPIF